MCFNVSNCYESLENIVTFEYFEICFFFVLEL